MKYVDMLSLLLVVIGGLNVGLVGVLDYNAISSLLGDMTMATTVVSGAIGLAALYEGFKLLKSALG